MADEMELLRRDLLAGPGGMACPASPSNSDGYGKFNGFISIIDKENLVTFLVIRDARRLSFVLAKSIQKDLRIYAR